MHEAVHHLKQLEKPRKADRWKSRVSAEQVTRVEKILGYTTWATFVSTTAATFAMRKDPLMKPPDQKKTAACPGDAGEMWVPYPQEGPSVVAHVDCHLRYLGRLFEICFNISEYLFTQEQDEKAFWTRDTLEDLHNELVAWYESLIGCLQIDSVKAPHTLSVHAQYHWSVMVLSELNFTSHLDDEDDATVALLVPVIQAQHMAAALAIADLIHRQCIHWGVSHVPTSFLQPINAAIPVITSDLEPAEHKSAFVKLAIGLHSLARRSVSAESVLRMLRLRLRQKRLMASGDIDRLFAEASEQWKASLWTPPPQTRHESSSNPNPGFTMATSANVMDGDYPDGEGSRHPVTDGGGTLDESYDLLVSKWNNFNLRAFSSSSSSSN
ncbi:hypothetical protein LTR84_002055 [Exophiala bonariae]|uniref:Transcription factor domain-containing protein n=1 Tax=Exophiala bonariae TaxID=1690606 RepID=A0AAV9NAC0_9EURO|nr:hypothetical protein LTR84_002055 [Exophiala bonariae]